MAARDYLFIKNGEKIVFMGETWGRYPMALR